ncbi:MAG TPA: hypothetical protein VIF57_12520 [Polyangia bacterium]
MATSACPSGIGVLIPVSMPQLIYSGLQSNYTAFSPHAGDVSCQLVMINSLTGSFLSQTPFNPTTVAGFQTVNLASLGTAGSPDAVGYFNCSVKPGGIVESAWIGVSGEEPFLSWPGVNGHAVPANAAQACLTVSGSSIRNSNCSSVTVVIPAPQPGLSQTINTARVTVFSTGPGSVSCRVKSFTPAGAIYSDSGSRSSTVTNGFEDLDLLLFSGPVLSSNGGGFTYDCTLAQNTSVLATYTSP